MTVLLKIYGLVQGVGFRPFIKRIATAMKLDGQVRNQGGIVSIMVDADNERISEFVSRIKTEKPLGSIVERIEIQEVDGPPFRGFQICESNSLFDKDLSFVPADIAICEECKKELFDGNARRYGHPFISCTGCGPRFSIINALPYDRKNTTMNDFELCPKCQKEYDATEDFRCHAQTIACPDCGPELYFNGSRDNAMEHAIAALRNGRIVAVKDIGGYHFVCSANNSDTIKRLRDIKNREAKPFAIMFSSMAEVKKYATPTLTEEKVLSSGERPIVLLKKRKALTAGICDDSKYVGAMLPGNPIQEMLAAEFAGLIMTSGNISGEPIITDDSQMSEIAVQKDMDVLSHNRVIVTPQDDSIVKIVNERTMIVRRGRGYAPLPLDIENFDAEPMLALGGDLKASFALASGKRVILSQHMGDLEDVDSFSGYKMQLEHYCDLFRFMPDKILCDMHPGYFSRGLAENMTGNVVEVQHHVAHIASVAAEHGLDRYLGFAFDGTGYGIDRAVWGGEVFCADNGKITRKYHLKYYRIPAGDECARDAANLACFYLAQAGIRENINPLVLAALDANINLVNTSSMGRLFDVVSALAGVCSYNRYEGECAMKLENSIAEDDGLKLKFEIEDDIIVFDSIIRDVYYAAQNGMKTGEIAHAFHSAVKEMMLEIIAAEDCDAVAVSGGVFNNSWLMEELLKEIPEKLFFNEKVPAGDGGIALGQLYAKERGYELCV